MDNCRVESIHKPYFSNFMWLNCHLCFSYTCNGIVWGHNSIYISTFYVVNDIIYCLVATVSLRDSSPVQS